MSVINYIDPKQIPEWANWIATDENGESWWYEFEPVIDRTQWRNNLEQHGRCERVMPHLSTHWTQSKRSVNRE